jgi:hypothetical protein
MAIIETKLSIAELRKKLGKTVVVYPYRDKIVIRSRTNYNSGKYIKHRKRAGNVLREIHTLKRVILADPVKRAEYEAKCGPGLSAGNILVGELMKNYKSMYYGDSI